MKTPAKIARIIVALLLCGIALAQPNTRPPIFKFETDEFWLNLHHFLYVLGRADAKLNDAGRTAVANAPNEAKQALEKAEEQQGKVWAEAVTAYSKGLSLKDAIFDDPLPAIGLALADSHDAPNLTGAQIDRELRAVLERAAPVYRALWWPQHRAANEQWRSSTQALVDRYGQTVLRFLTKAYGMSWPATGYPVHISAYANWAGAYSTSGNLLVVATNADAGTRALNGLEIVFHEAMHQWDDEMIKLIREATRKANVRIPPNLSHALIFFTAGEAVRRAAPEHVPVADTFGIWSRGMMRFKAPIEEEWKPFLDGKGTRDEALTGLVTKLAIRKSD